MTTSVSRSSPRAASRSPGRLSAAQDMEDEALPRRAGSGGPAIRPAADEDDAPRGPP
eukprot:CAMPEP_0204597240 /NCGR_PEP_ID=MMETSP0661-20131031/53699_1 /ASSEMBLY_ACC=CAM_ASM_000606 /TAXON_ID=109239 /ORGANISM="Alexandrium margalefi, Strain AMGDE01CS-322" /LENGTH=56 /DNA_ID=CAMNT_0051607923 /DNA_START=49 /DNA_END=215 /DNA_ORIENTATION=+